MGLNKTNIYCENYILFGKPDTQRLHAEKTVSEAKRRFPDRFEGKSDSFFFDLRYTPPFERNFLELKRLQGTAAEAAGRRDEFKGYIIINLSGYLTHENDDFFEKTLFFLADMSGYWRYIFLVDDTNSKAARGLVRRVLGVFARANLFCEVRESNVEVSSVSVVNTICKEHGVTCTASVKDLFQRLFVQEAFSKEVISALIWDISSNCGHRINSSTLTELFSQRVPIVKYMLNEKEYSRFTNVIHRQKEKRYDEKEVV